MPKELSSIFGVFPRPKCHTIHTSHTACCHTLHTSMMRFCSVVPSFLDFQRAVTSPQPGLGLTRDTNPLPLRFMVYSSGARAKGPGSLRSVISEGCQWQQPHICQNRADMGHGISGPPAWPDVMRDIKANSSRHIRQSGVRFAWQDGYAGISVSPSQVGVVKRYIANQKEHHHKREFEEELVMLLERAGVRFDRAEVLG